MKALIFAAGEGTRLGSLTANTPKTLLKINGETLLHRLCRQMHGIGIETIYVVVGFQAEKIEAEAKRITEEFGMRFSYIINENLDRGNAYSFRLMKPIFKLSDDDFLLVESDLIVDEDFFSSIKFGDEAIACSSKFEIGMNGSFINEFGEVKLKEEFRVSEIKYIRKTMNIYYLPDHEIKHIMDTMGESSGFYEAYFHDICFEEFIYGGKWFEIDTKSDLSHAKVLFGSTSEKFTELSNRFGGYERYNYENFLLPTNDFNSKELYEMLFDPELIKNYPSSMPYIQDIASKATGIKGENILVGNGSSEFINILSEILPMSFDYHEPIFGEYKKFKREEGSIHKVIVNPNNPDGHSYTREELIKILESGDSIILDESFIDFGGESLLDNETLEKYPRLIIIKSYSKHLGVPGIRLGMLFTSNKDIFSEIQRRLPIWGVNSITERFLEVLPLFHYEIDESLKQISFERNRVAKEMSIFGEVSGAGNFIMLKTPFSSRLICEQLLDRGILIKDLKTNVGYNAIRLNIKNTKSNNNFIMKLREVYAELEECVE